MTFNIKTRSLILLILAIACVTAGYFAYTSYQKFSENKAFLALAKGEEKKIKDAQNQISDFLASYAKLTKEQQDANNALPVKNPSASTILAQIDNLSKASGMVLGNVSVREKNVNEVVPENGIESMNIELEASGSYPSLKNFLLLAESHLRIIDLQDISFQVESDTLIKFKMVLRTYYQK